MISAGRALAMVTAAGLCSGCGSAPPSPGAARARIEWAPARGRECIAAAPYHGACQGPRRVPVPQGAAAERARALGLGTKHAVSRVMVGTPLPSWVDAVRARPQPTLLWPVPGGHFFRGFGFVRRSLPDLRHDGVDVSAPVGTPIVAAADGLVVYADNGVQGYGNFLAILHGDSTTTFYAHCRAIYVAPGERVRRGQRVAEVGVTGITRAAHLHFEWHVRGRPTDPMPRLDRSAH